MCDYGLDKIIRWLDGVCDRPGRWLRQDHSMDVCVIALVDGSDTIKRQLSAVTQNKMQTQTNRSRNPLSLLSSLLLLSLSLSLFVAALLLPVIFAVGHDMSSRLCVGPLSAAAIASVITKRVGSHLKRKQW